MKKKIKKWMPIMAVMCALIMMLMSINSVNVSAATTYKKTMYVKSTYLHPMRGCKWSSSNKSVASVSSKGMIKALKSGIATIQAKRGKTVKYRLKVTVKKKPVFSTFDRSMYTGDSLTLKVTNAPGKLTWKSSNKNVATISSKGKVVAKRTGKTRISVSSGSWSASCNIKVVDKKYKNPSIRQLAPRADSCVLNAFEKLKFNLVIDFNVSYAGYFSAQNQSITLQEADDTIYHELGHLLGWVSYEADTSTEWTNIYNSEKSKFKGYNKTYATQSKSEFFAECYRQYVLNKANLRNTCPKTYAYIQKAITNLNNMPSSRLTRMHDTYYKAGIWKR